MLRVCFLLIIFLVTPSHSYNSDSIYIDGFNDAIQWIVEPSSYKTNTTRCREHLIERPNIIEMLDSTSKLQSGILHGNYIDMGNLDECVQIAYISSESDIITGKYCLIRFTINTKRINEIMHDKYEVDEKAQITNWQNVTAGYAVCIPESCSQNDIESAIKYLKERNIISLDNIKVTCTSSKNEPNTPMDWIAIGLILVTAIIMTLSTFYDLYLRHNAKQRNAILSSFSVYTNGANILMIKPTNQSSDIHCLHGLRVISLAWIILFHRGDKHLTAPLINFKDMYEWETQIHSTYIAAGSIAVDTFLVMSGFLLCHNYIKERELSKSFNIIKFYIKRYLRLTPALAALLIITLSFKIRIGSGIIYESKTKIAQEVCLESWWAVLLYIHNYTELSKMCLPVSWYLAIDMQLFLLSPLILIPLCKHPKYTINVIFVLLLASVGIIVGILANSDVTYATFVPNRQNAMVKGELGSKIYFPTHTRYGPWLMGILLGYAISKTRISSKKTNKIFSTVIWLMALIVMVVIVLGVHPYQTWDNKTSKSEAIAYFSCHKLAWAICICWIIFMCHRGQGGIVNWVLCWGFWQPISRISYCMYLLHPLLQNLTLHTRTPLYFSDINMIYQFFGDFTFALVIALVWSLAFEQPVLVIVKQLFKKNNKIVSDEMEIPAKFSESRSS